MVANAIRTTREWAIISRARAREFRQLMRDFPTCQVCCAGQSASQHHLFPREIVRKRSAFPPPGSTLRANGSYRTPKVAVCKTCHHDIHKRFSNDTLYDSLNSLAAMQFALFGN